MLRALCIAMLDPVAKLKQLELAGDYTSRLALMEEYKSMPFAAVWDYYCLQQGAPVGEQWLVEVKKYEKDVLSLRK
jgi:L-rhamnose isomerase